MTAACAALALALAADSAAQANDSIDARIRAEAVESVAAIVTELRHTLTTAPGPRRTAVPLYVLVDRRSASAAEDIPFVLQNQGRATIVGERTAGAGRNVALRRAAHGLSVGISISRVYDPATGRQWERVGIEPDVAAPSAEALDVALAHALRSLAGPVGGIR